VPSLPIPSVFLSVTHTFNPPHTELAGIMSTQSDKSITRRELHRLCERCNSIFSSSAVVKGLSRKREKHHFQNNLDGLRESAASGCHFCTLLETQLPSMDDYFRSYWERKQDRPLELEIVPAPTDEHLFNIICTHGGDPGNECLGVNVLEERSVRLRPAHAQAQTCSPDHADLARTWIGTCLSEHGSTCGYRNDKRFLPTRFLEINGSEGDLSVRLYLPSVADLQRGLDYCTLSHCWGDANHVLCLTAESLPTFKTAIPTAKIPATYADALRITRSIGVWYLWIDSLCILQDSPDGWTQEASAMASVYENSYCNIAAATAKDSQGGCYATRDPLTFAPCRIATTDKGVFYACPDCFNGSLDELEWESDSGLFSRA